MSYQTILCPTKLEHARTNTTFVKTMSDGFQALGGVTNYS